MGRAVETKGATESVVEETLVEGTTASVVRATVAVEGGVGEDAEA